MNRDDRLYYKDRAQLRENDSATKQSRSNRQVIKDYSLKHKVSIEYDMSDDSIHDRMCILRIGDNAAVLDWEELQRSGRFI